MMDYYYEGGSDDGGLQRLDIWSAAAGRPGPEP